MAKCGDRRDAAGIAFQLVDNVLKGVAPVRGRQDLGHSHGSLSALSAQHPARLRVEYDAEATGVRSLSTEIVELVANRR